MMTPQQISSSYDRSIVWRRRDASAIDLVLLLVLLGLAWLPRVNEENAYPALFFGIILGYYVLLESLLGATAGKLVLGLRVVDATGHRPGIHRVLIRTVLRLIEVNPIAAGGLPAGLFVLFTKNRQRLGDILAGTYVLRLADLTKLDSRTEHQDGQK